MNKKFDNLPEQKEQTFVQPFTVFVCQGQLAKKFKNIFTNLILGDAK
jgi:hypothetical protein